jgi:hypothetical protein
MSFEIDLAVPKIIEALLKYDSTRKLPPIQKKYIDGLLEKLKEAQTQLTHLSDYLDDSEVFGAAGDVVENQDFWESLPAGYYVNLDHSQANTTLGYKGLSLKVDGPEIRRRSEQLKQLYTVKSKTLNQLFKATVDILSIRRFSEGEIKFASELGNNFQYLQWAWHDQFKRNVWVEENGIVNRPLQTQAPWGPQQIRQFLTLAKTTGLISGWKEWQEGPAAFFKIADDGLTVESVKFITGGWFEAYASEVVKNTLSRRTDSYESYTEVEYWTKQAFGGYVTGDFDLLVRINDTVIMIECKSGHIKSDQTKKICAKTNLLKTTLKQMGVLKFLFILVFSPLKARANQQNNPNVVQRHEELERSLKELYDSEFVILEPNHLAPALAGYLESGEISLDLSWQPNTKNNFDN